MTIVDVTENMSDTLNTLIEYQLPDVVDESMGKGFVEILCPCIGISSSKPDWYRSQLPQESGATAAQNPDSPEWKTSI